MPLQCRLCGRCYNSPAHFQSHVRRVHKKASSLGLIISNLDAGGTAHHSVPNAPRILPAPSSVKSAEDNGSFPFSKDHRSTNGETQFSNYVGPDQHSSQQAVEENLDDTTYDHPASINPFPGVSRSRRDYCSGGHTTHRESRAREHDPSEDSSGPENSQMIRESVNENTFHSVGPSVMAYFLEKGNLSKEVNAFYKSFGDIVNDIFPKSVTFSPPIEELSQRSKNVLMSGINRKLTIGECHEEWRLVQGVESSLPPQYRQLVGEFPTAEKFASYVQKTRRVQVQQEGLKRAIVQTNSGTNTTGVFRSILEIMREEIKRCGGISAITPFERKEVNGDRVISAPWNANAIKEYSTNSLRIITVDIYCDGTILSNSGSQSVSVVRVRFQTLRGRASKWHEVGIAPALITPPEDIRLIDQQSSVGPSLTVIDPSLFPNKW